MLSLEFILLLPKEMITQWIAGTRCIPLWKSVVEASDQTVYAILSEFPDQIMSRAQWQFHPMRTAFRELS
jgi:hypothetical protein